jgi:hypothetical protein
VNEFIKECRREWKRLRVSDPVADEMAADLAADLDEAEDEGATPQEVLGSGASDPRSFAASWAAERGVIPSPRLASRLPTRALTLAATAALAVIAALGAALVIFASPEASGPEVFLGVLPPSPSRVTVLAVAPDMPPQANDSGVDINTAGSILLIVGLAGIILSLVFLLWSSRARPRSRTFSV